MWLVGDPQLCLAVVRHVALLSTPSASAVLAMHGWCRMFLCTCAYRQRLLAAFKLPMLQVKFCNSVTLTPAVHTTLL
jgi:hypothetical protein